MSSIRVRFLRGEEVKFISHLDLMKVFERALRRSKLLISYSQGFNPHPRIVFGLPLPVGVTSETEFADFELSEEIKPDEFTERLNKQLPPGIKILQASFEDSGENIMASVTMASYDVHIRFAQDIGIEYVKEKIRNFMKENSIVVKKEGKNGIKNIDIRPMIHKFDIEADPESGVTDDNSSSGSIYCLKMLLSAGSIANLKAELLVEAFKSVSGLDASILKIHRSGLFLKGCGNGE